ncbi:MAG: winged helix-turn-helix transcriptional regulator [Methanobacteriota archaeon]|nr:MAG: winged helix-turn-helix transcriptional regulator [Euryarchaeota archaeon]
MRRIRGDPCRCLRQIIFSSPRTSVPPPLRGFRDLSRPRCVADRRAGDEVRRVGGDRLARDESRGPRVLVYGAVAERGGFLKSEEDGHRKRYYIARAFVEAQRRILAILRQDVPRKIVLELLFHGERTFGELQSSVGVSKSTLSYHLQKLLHRELLLRAKRERESVFSIKDLEEVRKLLLANRSSFQDDAVNRFADLWTNIHS